jgi:signal transduction histidine kinase
MRRPNPVLPDGARPAGGLQRLERLARTSSFRLALLYTGLFSASVLILLAMMLWWGSAYVTEQTDQVVIDALGDVQAAAAKPGSGGVRAVVAGLVRHPDPGSRYLLQDHAGHVLAGNMPAVPPVSGTTTWYPQGGLFRFWPLESGVRGAGTRLENGDYLFVGRSDFALNEMRETFTHAFLWVLGATLLLAVGGGVVMSLGSLRRVEAIGRTSQEIVAGDLSRRIALRGTGDEFDRLALSLNAMLDRIQGLMEGLNQVSSDIAHDLRTPLTRLRQRLEFAHRTEADADALRSALGLAIRDVDALLETFSALLRIAQIESHAQAAEFTRLDLSAELDALVEFYAPLAEEQGHALAGSIAPALSISGDAELLTQAFANLIENAIRHSDPGTVTVAAMRLNDRVVVEVKDPGPGIPAEFQDKVLQRFFRLERSRTTPGTGLGLSLVAAVAQMHRAELRFARGEGGFRVGLRFGGDVRG